MNLFRQTIKVMRTCVTWTSHRPSPQPQVRYFDCSRLFVSVKILIGSNEGVVEISTHWKLDVHRPADFHRFRIICLESFRPSPPGGTCRPVAANKTIFRLIYSFAVLTDGLDTSAAFRRFRLICISSASVPAAVE